MDLRVFQQLLAGIILDKIAGPLNFSLCFLLAFFFMTISYVFLSFTREQTSAARPNEHPLAFWGKSLTILKTDSNFQGLFGSADYQPVCRNGVRLSM